MIARPSLYGFFLYFSLPQDFLLIQNEKDIEKLSNIFNEKHFLRTVKRIIAVRSWKTLVSESETF